MKKTLTFLLMFGLSCAGFAKKVKFAVDMDTITINTMGMHIGGDFQVAAGFPMDWDSGTTPLTQEGTSSIYSIVVDIPAFKAYEFKFINGNQWYGAEFVPFESRVDPMSDDNRWLYVDSLSNDTTFAGAIIYSSNAPRGLTLMRFYVDMTNEWFIDPAGVHVAGSFQNWDPTRIRMWNFGSNIYQIIAYDTAVTSTINDFKYYNGNTAGVSESVPGACAVNNNRELVFAKDTVLEVMCFSGCSACVWNSVAQIAKATSAKLFPNPAKDQTVLSFNEDGNFDVSVTDLTGKILSTYNGVQNQVQIDSRDMAPGMYFVNATNKNWARTYTLKFIVE